MDDLISRQAAIDALHMHLMYRMGTDSNKKRLDEWINNLPSAQPERNRGYWIEVDDHYNRISGRCSVCGWESHMYEDDVVGMDFCPNCGARLQEGEENGCFN